VIIALTLLIPFLGVGMLLCDWQRQRALPMSSRSRWAIGLQVLGSLSVLAGMALAVLAALLLRSPNLQRLLVTFPLWSGLSLVVSLTGVKTFHVPRSWPRADEDENEGAVLDRYSPPSLVSDLAAAHLRSGAWIMTLLPLLFVMPILGMFGVFLIVIAAIVLSSVVQSRRSFQSQLLWLLAIATRNKLPLADELRSLAEDRGVSLKQRLQQAAKNLEHGDPLWMALERHGLLPTATIAAIRVSEGGGRLDETLRRLATQTTDRLKVFNLSQIGQVLTQVFILIAVGTFLVSGVMYFIIPKFKTIFEGFEVEMPASTRLLIDMSDTATHYSGGMFFWAGIGISLLLWHMLRHLVGWSSLPFPVLMHWFPKRDAPEVLRALGGIAREGVSIPQKILLLIERPGRPDLGARYRRVSESMSDGVSLSDSLYDEGILTRLQCEAVAAGERGGHLEFVLFSLAESAEQREYRRGAYWAELLKPIAIVACGFVTAFVVIAMFLPLVKLLNELS
jgi:type IV pilus assembly protein PilC